MTTTVASPFPVDLLLRNGWVRDNPTLTPEQRAELDDRVTQGSLRKDTAYYGTIWYVPEWFTPPLSSD